MAVPVAQESAEQLLEAAQQALAQGDEEAACAAVRHAADVGREDFEILSQSGAMMAEVGTAEEAIALLEAANRLQPDKSHENYLCLAQLLDGDAAVSSCQKGVELLEREASQAQGTESQAEAQQLLSSALCTLAEIKLDDEEATASAQAEAEQLLLRSHQACPSNPEPLQALATLRSEQDRREEALALLQQSTGLWLSKANPAPETMQEDAPAGQVATEEADEDAEGLHASLPPYAFRMETAKLLLDLDTTTSAAEEVLEGMLEEDDSCLEVWYLLALAQYAGGAPDEAKQTLHHVEGLLAKPGAIAPTDDPPDLEDLKDAVEQSLAGKNSSP